MWRRQERRAEWLLRRVAVELPVPLTVQSLIAALETARDRPIQLVAMTSQTSTLPCGLWVATPETDYVLYSRATSMVLEVQTLLHELMHMALDHIGSPVIDGAGEVMAEVFSHEGVDSVMARSPRTYDQQQERDAEVVATYLGARLDGLGDVVNVAGLHDDAAAVVYRIAAALTD